MQRAHSRNLKTIMACLAIGMAASAIAIRSLAREADVNARAPHSVIEQAFATLGASPIDSVPVKPARSGDSCSDFAFAFLNPSCSKFHKKHVERIHRIATFVVAHGAGSPKRR
jgi:hypothetical protein